MNISNFLRNKAAWLTLLIFVLCTTMLVSQANIKIGYNIAFPSLAVNDEILRNFQPVDSEVVEPFGSIGFMHGIQLGVRYKWSNIAAEIGWENVSRDRTSLAYRASSDSFLDRQYNYNFTSYTFGLDNYIGKFGIGSTLLYQRMGVSRTVGNNNLSLVKERQWALRLQFIIQVQQSSLVSLMLKPYYQFNLGIYNLQSLANDAGVTNISNFIESPKMFGITLVFYNGKQ